MSKRTNKFAAALLGLAIFVSPMLVSAEEIPTNDIGVLLAAGEAIGTLPTYWSEDELPNFGFVGESEYDEMLKGMATELFVPTGLEQVLIEHAAGDGLALIGPGGWGDLGQPLTRVRIFGSVRVRLNESLANDPAVSINLAFGENYADAWLSTSLDAGLPHFYPVSGLGHQLELGLSSPVVQSLLADQLFTLSAFSSSGFNGHFCLAKNAGVYQIRMSS